MLNKLNVEFIPRDKDVELSVPRPQPSKRYIPEWFKSLPTFIENLDGSKMQATAKKCMPFMDSLTSGYTQELACDVMISPSEDGKQVSYSWAGDFRPLSTAREDFGAPNLMPQFPGYYDLEFHWNSFWEPKTPNGYSTFYFHPANRFDLPFLTHSAIIDTDRWPVPGPVPFIIKEGFSGLIPAGTPIYQMLFIKRDTWNSKEMKYDEKIKKLEFSVRRTFSDGYKKVMWSKKEYN